MSTINFEQTGIAEPHQLKGRLPNDAQKKRGPYAVIECYEEIPCNPCVMSCTFDAIYPFEDINDLPFVDFDKCTGCAVCASICPGLAIFIIDESKEGDMGTIRLPYEYWPLPAIGDRVMALTREGKALEPVEVKAVSGARAGKTPLVMLGMQKDRLQMVRGCRPLTEEERRRIDSGLDAADRVDTWLKEALEASPVVCRCEGVTLQKVRDLIAAGYHSVDEIKHLSRAGMGPCQGRTCRQIITAELLRAGVAEIDHLNPGSFRPPGGTVTLGQLAEGGQTDA